MKKIKFGILGLGRVVDFRVAKMFLNEFISPPKKIFIAKKCSQKTNKKVSSEKIEYKLSNPRYKLKLSRKFPFKKILKAKKQYATAKSNGAITELTKILVI